MKLPGRRGGAGGSSSDDGSEAGDEVSPDAAHRERDDRAAARRGLEERVAQRAARRGATRAREGTPGSPPRRSREANRAGRAFAAALKQGADETRGRGKGVPSRIGKQALSAGAVAFGIFFDLLGVVLNLAIAAWARFRGPLGRVVGAARGAGVAASRALTPIRVLTGVVAGAAVLLALSQFADYRGVSIGTDAYAEVATVAPAPERERSETGSAHGYVMVPLALACLALLAVSLRRRRWQLCRVIAAGGLIAIAVSLIVDRPAGLDTGDLAIAYQGVEARLLGGFYAQIFAGLLLGASALLLGRELRLAESGIPARRERRPTPERGRKGLLRRVGKPREARA